ncbi:MAG TPA: FoF1 ATP synthase subunit a, partial [Burkholderiales bacterium]|nr:FoF1 ATP synthase subunit a [Burkholderiales bacterium]
MANGTLTSSEYIKHHLEHLTWGHLPGGTWGIAKNAEQAKEMGFWALNLDTFFVSLVLGAIFIFIFHKAARAASSGVPSGIVNFAEWMIEFVEDSVRGSFSGKNPLVAPLALTVFFWIYLMNWMDLIPVDYVPYIAKTLGVPFFKVVPTTDPNATFG